MVQEMQSNYCFVSWEMIRLCNFRCCYCYPNNLDNNLSKEIRQLKFKLREFELFNRKYDCYKNIENVLNILENNNKIATLGFTGGEPFIYKNFIKLCQKVISRDGYKIAIDTNLNTDKLEEFIEKIPPERVEYIYVSLHIMERLREKGRMDLFLKNINLIKKHGYNFSVNYVLYPPLMNRFEDDYKFFKEKGIRLKPIEFKGLFNGKKYRQSHTEVERNVLFKYHPEKYQEETWNHMVNHFQKPCSAGNNLLRIDSYGNVFRCTGDNKKLGTISEGFDILNVDTPCPIKRCPCFDSKRLFEKLVPA